MKLPRPAPLQRSDSPAFSLIELLVVMAVISLMLVLAAAAFNNFGKSTALAASGNRVAGILEQARQHALSQGAMTAVAIATDSASPKRNQAFVVLAARPRSDGAALTAADWKQVSKWEVLPEGITVDSGSTFTESGTKLVPSLPSQLPERAGERSNSFRYVIFQPSGAILGGGAAGLRLVEGIWPSGAASPTYTRPGSDGTPGNYYKMSLIAATGRLKVDRP